MRKALLVLPFAVLVGCGSAAPAPGSQPLTPAESVAPTTSAAAARPAPPSATPRPAAATPSSQPQTSAKQELLQALEVTRRAGTARLAGSRRSTLGTGTLATFRGSVDFTGNAVDFVQSGLTYTDNPFRIAGGAVYQQVPEIRQAAGTDKPWIIAHQVDPSALHAPELVAYGRALRTVRVTDTDAGRRYVADIDPALFRKAGALLGQSPIYGVDRLRLTAVFDVAGSGRITGATTTVSYGGVKVVITSLYSDFGATGPISAPPATAVLDMRTK